MFKRVFDFFVFSSLFVAVCAVAMVWQTYHLFHLPLFYSFLGFVFSGTLCSYNFHWYLTPDFQSGSVKVNWSVANRNLHLTLFLISAIAASYFLFQLRQHWLWLLITAFVTFLYSAPKIPYYPFTELRKIAVAKTLFLALAWMHITAALPLLLLDVTWQPTNYLFVLNRFFLLYPICILFDYRDRESDRKEGIRSIITLSDDKTIDIFFWGCLVASFITCIILYFYHVSILTIIALAAPVVVLGFLYNPLKTNFSDYWYYFVVDGLTALSPLLLLIFQI